MIPVNHWPSITVADS